MNCPVTEKPLPSDLGGYQQIIRGTVQEGDIIVHRGEIIQFAFCTVGAQIRDGAVVSLTGAPLAGPDYHIYRQMPVPKQGDTDTAWKKITPQDAIVRSFEPPAPGTPEPQKPEVKETNPKDIVGSTKLPLHLWPTTATALGSLALLEGALKYGRSNFRAVGVRSTIYYDACRRHLDAWLEGEDNAPDSGLPHLAHALACIAVLVDAQAAGKLNDDRVLPADYRKFVDSMTPHVARLKEKYSDQNPKHYTIADRS